MSNPLKSLKHPVTLAFVALLLLASCGKKPEEAAAPPPSAAPAPTAPAGSAAPSPAATAPGTAKTSTGTSTGAKPALSAEAQKLGVKPKDASNCPENAPVKGNVTKKRGELYFTPKFADYKQVKPEICFKDTATAEKAGFRAPKAQ
jgi:hypothetical protein